ncbi:MAG: hypothetical protein DSZ12_06760 [Sulfurovum sp.]|nr:MAG: hypothetical protein DSZ12_06760 [Sulfurovum sp.]
MKEILKSHTILYAEDDKAIQIHTEEYLKRYFHTVYVASDGKEALSLYKQYAPDVMMLDIQMPYIDGLEVARHIRKNNQTAPIVIFTAFTDTPRLIEATELNLSKYLVKPVAPTAFKEALLKISQQLEHINNTEIIFENGYKWHTQKAILTQDNRQIFLTEKEKTLLALLVKNHYQCVSFEEIMAQVWEDDFDAEISIQSVKFQVSMLRKKLPKDSIVNIYAKGYKLILS